VVADDRTRGRAARRWPGVIWCAAAAVAGTAGLHPPLAAADEPSISILTTRPQPMMTNLGDAYGSIRLGPDRDAFEAASAALAEHHDLDFRETPLRDAVATIAEKAGVRIVFDHESLDDVAIDIDATMVSGSFEDMSLRAILREVLGDTDLDMVFRNERFVVTTVDAAAEHSARVFYPVLAGTDVDELIMLIERTVAPDSWDTVGGKGAIAAVPGQMGTGLVVRQTEAVHEEIAGLLAGLDAALWTADVAEEGVAPRLVRAYPVADPVVRESAAEQLVGICNDSLPRAADPQATVDVVGDALVVRSRSRAFHVMAAQVLAALQGVDAILIEGDDDAHKPADEDARDAHATGFRGAGFRREGVPWTSPAPASSPAAASSASTSASTTGS